MKKRFRQRDMGKREGEEELRSTYLNLGFGTLLTFVIEGTYRVSIRVPFLEEI